MTVQALLIDRGLPNEFINQVIETYPISDIYVIENDEVNQIFDTLQAAKTPLIRSGECDIETIGIVQNGSTFTHFIVWNHGGGGVGYEVI